jgi:hypothetical protein
MISSMSRLQRQAAAGLYVVLAAGLAIAGALAQSPIYYLAAVVVTLPLGVVALVGVYVGYALIQGVGGLFLSTTTADGSQAAWLRAASATWIVVLFVAAAVGNLAVLRQRRALAHRGREVAGTPVPDRPVVED